MIMLTTIATNSVTAVDAASALVTQQIDLNMNPSHVAKVPVQQRGKDKFNLIVEVAESLVLTCGIDTVNHYSIAKKAKIPASSVYQFFPTMGALFAVMAEKHYLITFHEVPKALEEMEIKSWQDLAVIIVNSAYDFYSRDKISEILFLDVYLSEGIREYSTSRLNRLGLWCMQFFMVLYKKSDLVGLDEKLSICIDLIKTIFIRSVSLHNEITEEYKQEAHDAITGYLGLYFAKIGNRI